jgi:hypothetical protein
VTNPTDDPRVSALIHDNAGNPTGHGYKIQIKIGDNVPGFINKTDMSHYTFEDIVKIAKKNQLNNVFDAIPVLSHDVPLNVIYQIEQDINTLPEQIQTKYREILFSPVDSLELTSFEKYFEADPATDFKNMADFSLEFIEDLETTIKNTRQFLTVATGLRMALALSEKYTYGGAQDLLMEIDDIILSKLGAISDTKKFQTESLFVTQKLDAEFDIGDPLLDAISALEDPRKMSTESSTDPDSLVFVSTSASFAVGSYPTFTISGDPAEIDHIECNYEGKNLDKEVVYTTSDTSLTVTELAEISNKAKTDTIAAIPASKPQTYRYLKTEQAGKGDYQIIVFLTDKTEITLTAKAE